MFGGLGVKEQDLFRKVPELKLPHVWDVRVRLHALTLGDSESDSSYGPGSEGKMLTPGLTVWSTCLACFRGWKALGCDEDTDSLP